MSYLQDKKIFRKGFTLMELIVSIGIVIVLTILISIAIFQVTGMSERARCAYNLGQIGKAVHAYVADNGGVLPPGDRKNMGGSLPKILALGGYGPPMKTDSWAADIYYCPTNVRLGSPPANGFPPSGYKAYSGYPLGYRMNASIFLITSSDSTNSAYIADSAARVRIQTILLPAKTMIFADTNTRPANSGGPPTAGYIKASYFTPQSSDFSGFGLVHNGKMNMLFLDGHVESFTGDKPLPVASLPGQTKPWW